MGTKEKRRHEEGRTQIWRERVEGKDHPISLPKTKKEGKGKKKVEGERESVNEKVKKTRKMRERTQAEAGKRKEEAKCWRGLVLRGRSMKATQRGVEREMWSDSVQRRSKRNCCVDAQSVDSPLIERGTSAQTDSMPLLIRTSIEIKRRIVRKMD